MSANVIPFKARRPQPEPASNCSCRPDRLCYPHRLSNLAELLDAHHYAHEGELLIPRAALDDALADALTVIRAITSECLPAHERRTP